MCSSHTHVQTHTHACRHPHGACGLACRNVHVRGDLHTHQLNSPHPAPPLPTLPLPRSCSRTMLRAVWANHAKQTRCTSWSEAAESCGRRCSKCQSKMVRERAAGAEGGRMFVDTCVSVQAHAVPGRCVC